MPPTPTQPLRHVGNALFRFWRTLLDAATPSFLSGRPAVRAGGYGRLGKAARELLPRLRGEIDPERFAGVARAYREGGNGVREKYLELDTWLGRHLTHAEAIGLFEGPPRRILDIGTGNGYFPFIATRLGHEVVATDVDTVPLYDDLVALTGIRRVVHAVQTFRLLPDLGGRFDLVTAFNTVFDRVDDTATWTPREWDFFLHDIRDHQLRPEGEIILKLNPNRKRIHDKRSLARFFRSLGGDVAMPFIHLRVEGGAFVDARRRSGRAAPGQHGSLPERPSNAKAA